MQRMGLTAYPQPFKVNQDENRRSNSRTKVRYIELILCHSQHALFPFERYTIFHPSPSLLNYSHVFLFETSSQLMYIPFFNYVIFMLFVFSGKLIYSK